MALFTAHYFTSCSSLGLVYRHLIRNWRFALTSDSKRLICAPSSLILAKHISPVLVLQNRVEPQGRGVKKAMDGVGEALGARLCAIKLIQ